MPDRETLRHTKWDGKYHGVAAASVGKCAVSALAQKKCFVTAILLSSNGKKFNGRFSHFSGEFCVTHAYGSLCPRFDA